MKIGIITYHFARNYGAVLQCFALSEYLSSVGHDVKVIDYVTETQARNNSLFHKRHGIKNLAINIALLPFVGVRMEKERLYAEFIDKRLHLTRRVTSLHELAALIAGEGFDVVISGSDQVFNPKIADFDEAFLLPFPTDGRKIAFAASLGGATEEDLVRFAKDIAAFDFISLREEESVAKIEQLTGKRAQVMPDPVFLLTPNEWQVNADQRLSRGDYVLLYYLYKGRATSYVKAAERIAAKRGIELRIINSRYSPSSFRPESIHDAGPTDFIGLIEGASVVCTDSFHATAFSIIFNRPFVSFEPHGNNGDKRKTALLDATDLREHSVSMVEDNFVQRSLSSASLPAYDATPGVERLRSTQLKLLHEMLGGD